MKRALLTTCMSLMTITGATFAADVPPLPGAGGAHQFDGKWVLDKKASPSFQVAPAALTQQFKTDGDKLIIRSNYEQPKDGMYPIFWIGVMTEELQLQPDGKELVSNIGPYQYISKTTQEDKKLVTDWTANLANGDTQGKVEGQWIRTLSPDGKQMTMEMSGKCSDGRQMQATLVFHRK